MRQAGVHFKPLPHNELLGKLHQFGQVSEFSRLLAQVLALFKAAFLDLKSLVSLAKHHEDQERMQAAAFLFEPVYESFQQHLRDTNTIDFEDMIGKAIDYVENGRYQSSYSHLLVDEFQDISASRARLVKALLAQNPDNGLFAWGMTGSQFIGLPAAMSGLPKILKNISAIPPPVCWIKRFVLITKSALSLPDL